MTEQELAHLEADLTMGMPITPDRVRRLLDSYMAGDVRLTDAAYQQGYDDGMAEGTVDSKEQFDSGYSEGYECGFDDGIKGKQ